MTMGEESIPAIDNNSLLQMEKFVNQMDIVSTKILKDYGPAITEVMNVWKEKRKRRLEKKAQKKAIRIGNSSSSDSSSSSMESESEVDDVYDKEQNDFRVDRRRIKAAHNHEKTHQRATFDPDFDGFNFGYEKALLLKVRMNLLKIIRKEILANNCRFWDQAMESLRPLMSTTEEL